ncbi:MAG TPA: 3'(2'),5'-bisphosphate nucleotidase CysQ [Azonexus sp.]|nr:3'(2'),5'-bisphosphate nucleotidase CysQ [Azonexus sp.]
MKITYKQLETLCQIALAAGQEIMSVYMHGGQTWQKDDASPLTEADLRADKLIRTRLEESFPGLFILSEESVSNGEAATDTFFLVDPLDGTKEFLKRNDEFTVNIGLVHLGQVIAGVVFAPALGELFYAAKGLGAWKQGRQAPKAIKVANQVQGQPLRVTGSRSHGGEALDKWMARLPAKHTFLAVGSSLKFCRIAEGQADIYPRLGPTSQWDTAAGHCVLEVAGGSVTDLYGEPLNYGLDRPVLNPEFIAVSSQRLLATLNPKVPPQMFPSSQLGEDGHN